MKQYLFAAFVAVILSGFAFGANTLVVNSMYWEDILSGSVYAQAMGYNYIFLISPPHADYIAGYLSSPIEGKVFLFESDWPVSADFSSKLSGLAAMGKLSIESSSMAYPLMDAKMPKDYAVIVGRQYGAEALSLAPYAALKKAPVFFAEPASVQSIADSARGSYKTVMVYGSIASALKSGQGLEVINTGSVYSDNLEIAGMFLSSQPAPAKQVNLASGTVFEHSMVSAVSPIILLEKNSEAQAQSAFLKSRGIAAAVVFDGDASISGPVSTLKEKAGISVFAKLGEGYPKDSLVRNLAAVEIPTMSTSPLVVVNSKSYADVMSGAAYAASNGYGYAFALTPSHADYLGHYLSSISGDVYYYEGAQPVSSGMGQAVASIGTRATYAKESFLPSYFASKGASAGAIIVGSDNGAEGLSIAPYAALKGYPLLFADAKNVDSMVATAKAKYSYLMAYGSIASSLKSKEGVDVINTGSIYSDNAKALKLFLEAKKGVSQVALVSGRVFEKSMVSKDFPVALIGMSSSHPEVAKLLSSSGVKSGVVFGGDIGTEEAVAALKRDAGLSVFLKLGEGFSGDAKMRELAVLGLPYHLVEIELAGPEYIAASKSFSLIVKNKATVPVHIRATVSLPSGLSASSAVMVVQKGGEGNVMVPIDAIAPSQETVPEALFALEYGSDPVVLDNAYSLNYTAIKVVQPPAEAQPALPAMVEEKGDGGAGALLAIIAAAIILAAGAFFLLPAASGKKIGGKKK